MTDLTPLSSRVEAATGPDAIAFLTAADTRRRDDEGGVGHAQRTYRPSSPGVHVCGADHEENRFYTVADFPAPSDAAARAMWEAARAECAVGGDDYDVVVDLMLEEGHADDFSTTRQLLPRLTAACLRALAAKKGRE